MDKFGQGVEFRYDDLPNNRDLNFTNFTKQMILEMCILSGCDYLPSLPGMGLKRAHGLIRRFGNYRKVLNVSVLNVAMNLLLFIYLCMCFFFRLSNTFSTMG
jgi:5'-3' exonuclease